MKDERAYATDNGFYEGDTVEFEGRRTTIRKIVSKYRKTWFGNELVVCSIVELSNGRVALDVQLTRVE